MFSRGSEEAHLKKYQRKRKFTDLTFAIVFLGYIAGLGAILSICLCSGALSNLWYKEDYLGFRCGIGPGPLGFANYVEDHKLQSKNWSENRLLWIPFLDERMYHTVTPVCVRECPLTVDQKDTTLDLRKVHTYGITLANGTKLPNTLPRGFDIRYSSVAFYGRCIPLSFDFMHSGPFSKNFTAKFVENFLFGTVEVMRSWQIVLCATAIAAILSIIYIHFLSKFTRAIIYISLLGTMCGIGFIGLRLFCESKATLGSIDPISRRLYFTLALISWLAAGIGMMFFLVYRKKIDETCAVIEVSGKLVGANAGLFFIPVFAIVLFIGVLSTFLFIAVMALSLGEKILSESAQSCALKIVPGINPESLLWDMGGLNVIEGIGIYLLVGLVWCTEVVSSYCFMVLSFCYVIWYFTDRTSLSDKIEHCLPAGTLRKALRWTATFHFGTIVLGSLVVAIIQILQVLFRVAMFQASKVLKRNEINRFVFYVTDLIVTVSKKILSFGTRNGYILTCITSKNFCSSTTEACQVLSERFVTLMLLQFFKELILFLGKLFVVCGTLLISDALFSSIMVGTTIVRFYPMVVIAAASYFISSSFFYLLSVSFQTTLICFAYDSHHNGGCFAPKELRKFLSIREMIDKRTGIPNTTRI